MPDTRYILTDESKVWRYRYLVSQVKLLNVQDHFLFGFTTSVEGTWLAILAAHLPPDSIAVELGVFLGKSTRYLTLGTLCSKSKLICVDPMRDGPDHSPAWDYILHGDPYSAFRATVEVSLTQSSRVDLHPETEHMHLAKLTSQAAVKHWYSLHPQGKLGKVGLLFIDGDHTRCEQDYEEWLPLLESWAMVALDDVLVNGAYGSYGPDNTYARMREEGWVPYVNLGKLVFLTRDPGFWRVRAAAFDPQNPATEPSTPGNPMG